MNAFGVVPRWRSSKPWSVEQARQARAREVVDVRRDDRPPALPHRARDAAAGVGEHQHDRAARREQRPAPGRAPRRDRAGARSRRRARPPGTRRRAGRRSSGPRSARPARAGRARSPDANLLGSTPVTGSQPRVARLVEQEADPAAEIEQRAPVRRAAPAARAGRARSPAGPPPPRRSRRTRPRRMPLELGLGRDLAQLHVRAVRAPDDVGQRGPEPVGRRDQALRTLLAGDGEVLQEPVSSADDATRAHAARG